jgi:hypothetical protein
MSKLEEVRQETPILDAIEGRSALVSGLLREGARWFAKLRRRRRQKHIDRTWHAKVGAPEREDTP